MRREAHEKKERGGAGGSRAWEARGPAGEGGGAGPHRGRLPGAPATSRSRMRSPCDPGCPGG